MVFSLIIVTCQRKLFLSFGLKIHKIVGFVLSFKTIKVLVLLYGQVDGPITGGRVISEGTYNRNFKVYFWRYFPCNGYLVRPDHITDNLNPRSFFVFFPKTLKTIIACSIIR